MEQCAFPFNFFSLKTSLNASLSSLWEHQIPGKLRKKSYVRGSLLSGQIGFNFLLARVVVSRDCTTCCVWAESRIRRGTGFHLGGFGTQDIIQREQTIQHLSWRRQNSNVREIVRFRQTPSWTQDEPISQTHTWSAVHRWWSRVGLLPAGLLGLSRQTSLHLSGQASIWKEREAEWCGNPYNILRFSSAQACLAAICKPKHLPQKGTLVLPGF